MYYTERTCYNYRSGLTYSDLVYKCFCVTSSTILDLQDYMYGLTRTGCLPKIDIGNYCGFTYKSSASYMNDKSIAEIYSYSNISEEFAINKNKEFFNALNEVCVDIHTAIDLKKYVPGSHHVPFTLLEKIEDFVGCM